MVRSFLQRQYTSELSFFAENNFYYSLFLANDSTVDTSNIKDLENFTMVKKFILK